MRNSFCGKLKINDINKYVTLCGWVNNYKILRNLIFINLRDITGNIQIFFNNSNKKCFKKAFKVRNEFCIKIEGFVRNRSKKNINNKIKNGNIEIEAKKISIFNKSKSLPINNNIINNTKSRMKYRYLDLRKPNMTYMLKIRHKITNLIHNFMNDNNFINVDTPILTKSTPEGARDYLIPSRTKKNNFYALPQSPQLFKQLLMISGIDRYYQIAKCFRDEDLRSDRQPEFTQIDIEASFIKSQKICNFVEKLIKKIWLNIINIKLNNFPSITYKKSIKMYGTDKPDIRNPLILKDINDILYKNKINIDNSYRISTLLISHTYNIKEKKILEYSKLLKKYNNTKLLWIVFHKYIEKKIIINYSKNKLLTYDLSVQIIKKTKAKLGDVIFIIYDKKNVANQSLDKLRTQIGNDFDIFDKSKHKPIWIKHFPMFEELKKNVLSSVHHPFTAPMKMSCKELLKNSKRAISDSYDLVINGYELGGGSVRVDNLEMQKTIFNIIGINEKEQNKKFGFFLEALKYGTPPHAGLAIGMERILMLILNENDIRNVIAFPKTTNGYCLTTDSPSKISKKMMKDLNIKKD
ncbi:aspartate--tRNA ligase [Buchnera aphidicola (Taiwanaphis decaspermi)]|uniref:aspartate--tRNA ligase n=1 Tax=Buchnera aphidicola TaxID=9 RepID=UPI0031B86AA6